MSLRVYNTLTRQKEDFQTVQPGKVGIYCCGPTVYMSSHIGHMVGPVIFDAVKRYLQYKGFDVTLVVNVTDVDDKLIARAQQEGTSVEELAQRVEADYVGNLARLGVDSIDHMPRATENIDRIIDLVRRLVQKGHAYEADGDVYFDVTTDEDYGKLSHRKVEEMDAGARIDVDERKRHPADFALWKKAKPDEPAWDSPWGQGRPGWHIECSAMSMGLLGETFDIHGGGLDLIFPHHENEVAQSESASGKPFVRYWMHNGLMQMDKEKMSKSIGNLVTVTELLDRYRPEIIRFFLLSTHYRRPIDFSDERIEETGRGVASVYRFIERYARIADESFYEVTPTSPNEITPSDPMATEPTASEMTAWRDRVGLGNRTGTVLEVYRDQRKAFLEQMNDDFNTAGAIGSLFRLLGALNRHADRQQFEVQGTAGYQFKEFREGVRIFRELAGILGVFGQPPAEPAAAGDDDLVGHLVELAVTVRAEAREHKQFQLADMVRDRLAELGITLEDRPDGTSWRRE